MSHAFAFTKYLKRYSISNILTENRMAVLRLSGEYRTKSGSTNLSVINDVVYILQLGTHMALFQKHGG
jgi:hypothetical protein